MYDIKKLLGKKIQTLRKCRNLTQCELAEKIGIEPTNFSKIETGRNYPSAENLAKIAKVLDVEISELFVFNEPTADSLKKEINKNLKLLQGDYEKLKLVNQIIKDILYSK